MNPAETADLRDLLRIAVEYHRREAKRRPIDPRAVATGRDVEDVSQPRPRYTLPTTPKPDPGPPPAHRWHPCDPGWFLGIRVHEDLDDSKPRLPKLMLYDNWIMDMAAGAPPTPAKDGPLPSVEGIQDRRPPTKQEALECGARTPSRGLSLSAGRTGIEAELLGRAWPPGPAPRHPNGGEDSGGYDGLFNAPFMQWPKWMVRTHRRLRKSRTGGWGLDDGRATRVPRNDGGQWDCDLPPARTSGNRGWDYQESGPQGGERVSPMYAGQRSLDELGLEVVEGGALGGLYDTDHPADQEGGVFEGVEARERRRDEWGDGVRENVAKTVDALPHGERGLARMLLAGADEGKERTQAEIGAALGVSQPTISRRKRDVSGKLKNKSRLVSYGITTSYDDPDGAGRE